ncbi:unnamed protein product [Allacma fusca]|uniref:Uncharacterized protein n=1 Tax=Allacma fusca TaxID=39272 RepID=A0A8J2LBE6_9HEXA|nr:unnamed protein product [Allacma fusca]
MTGSSVFDYIHQSDHAELAEQLGLGLAHSSGANVPSPGSEDGSSNSATNNPDGESPLMYLRLSSSTED